MTDMPPGPPGTPPTVVVWVAEGTWPSCVDAARRYAPDDARFVLLHVIGEEVPEAVQGAYAGLLGRHGRPDPGRQIAEYATESAGELLAAAAARLGRPCSRAERRGRTEREVVAAVAAEDADLLILARDGDGTRLGPKSLGRATRFAVDHAPCPVLLVWPGPAPSTGTIPPPPPHHHRRHH